MAERIIDEIESKEIEILEFPKEDYMPLKDYEGWRVAVLRACQNTRPEKICWMQKHMQTDESFVLTRGHCTLLLAGQGVKPELGTMKTIEMEPHRIYNIRKGTWHNHIMDDAGEVVIIENQNTCDDNSPVYNLSEKEKNHILQRFSD